MYVGKILEAGGHLVSDLRIKGQFALSSPDPNPSGERCHIQLILVSFFSDTWTLAPLKSVRELDMGSFLCSPMVGETTLASLWPSLIPCNALWCSKRSSMEVEREIKRKRRGGKE